MKWSVEVHVVIQSLRAESRPTHTRFDTEDVRWIRESVAENYWDVLLKAKSLPEHRVNRDAAETPDLAERRRDTAARMACGQAEA